MCNLAPIVTLLVINAKFKTIPHLGLYKNEIIHGFKVLSFSCYNGVTMYKNFIITFSHPLFTLGYSRVSHWFYIYNITTPIFTAIQENNALPTGMLKFIITSNNAKSILRFNIVNTY